MDEKQRQKAAFPRLCTSSRSVILNQLFQRVIQCLKPSFEVHTGPLSSEKNDIYIERESCFFFPGSVCNRSCTAGAAWGQCKQIPALHGYHTWSCHGLEQWPMTMHTVSMLANALAGICPELQHPLSWCLRTVLGNARAQGCSQSSPSGMEGVCAHFCWDRMERGMPCYG